MRIQLIKLNLNVNLAQRLEEAARQPTIIEHNGVRYQIEPEGRFPFYDTAKALSAIERSPGILKGVVRGRNH